MAKNNNNNKILYSVAIRPDGTLITAKEASKGQDYRCPECHQPMILRKSGNTGVNAKPPHFAHKTDITTCSPESALHKAFKTMAYDEITNAIEQQRSLSFQWHCQNCYEDHQGNLIKLATSVAMEKSLGSCQPDLALMDERGRVFAVIEVVVNHAPDAKTRVYYHDQNITMLVYRLKGDDELEDVSTRLSSPDEVTFCFNPRCPDCGQFLTQVHMYIMDGDCYRCRTPLKYAYIHAQDSGELYQRSGGNYAKVDDFTAEEIAFARSRGVNIQKRYSKTSNYAYNTCVCNQCRAFIGNHFIFTEYICEEDELEEMNKNRYRVHYQCRHCKKIVKTP